MRHEPWLSVQARRRPQRVALECGGERVTYGELEERAAGAAGALAERGVRAGDRAAIALPAGLDFAVALHACGRLGAAAVPLDLRQTGRERAARARGVATVVDAPLDARPAPPEASWEDDGVVLVVHTSGTTAEPKEVPLTFGNVRANAAGSALALGLDPAERWLCPLPLTHVGGLMVLLRSVIYGTTAVLLPPPFDAAAVADALNRGEATIVSLVPTMLARVLDAGLEHPPRLRCALLGGGPLDPALAARAVRAGVPVAQTYGLTEACSQVTVSEPGDPSTAGWPLPGVAVRLAADGEIVVEGPVVAGGGVLRTGDLGALDARGRLSVIGRKADTIVTGGENVAPAEVEAVLLAHPDVADAGVYARPHPEWGEAVRAKVVARAGTTLEPAALRAWCSARLAPYKVPKAFETVSALPRTASGKLLRRQL
ncbi:MAG TPA: AMP-binding protein [Solirubrobacteraceae bacterium]|nr:AMP-binding protein [Solirubrobacteraceae bacterium]